MIHFYVSCVKFSMTRINRWILHVRPQIRTSYTINILHQEHPTPTLRTIAVQALSIVGGVQCSWSQVFSFQLRTASFWAIWLCYRNLDRFHIGIKMWYWYRKKNATICIPTVTGRGEKLMGHLVNVMGPNFFIDLQRFWNCCVLRHIPIKTQKGLVS